MQTLNGFTSNGYQSNALQHRHVVNAYAYRVRQAALNGTDFDRLYTLAIERIAAWQLSSFRHGIYRQIDVVICKNMHSRLVYIRSTVGHAGISSPIAAETPLMPSKLTIHRELAGL